jgi:threonine dehydrogenase-like Zn-dependent dehydrogenase
VPEHVLAALKVAPATTELREMPLPDVPPDAALMKVEVAGVCGTDVSQYPLPLRGAPIIMGHENVGYLARVGTQFADHHGVKEGDLMFLEHYLPCGH